MGCTSSQAKKNKDGNVSQHRTTSEPGITKVFKTVGERQITDVYKIVRPLGAGAFGTVQLAIQKSSNVTKQYAIKTISKQKIGDNINVISREVSVLVSLDHPNIIKLYELYEDLKYIYLVMEYCSGGDLLDRVSTAGHYAEQEVCNVIRKIFQAVSFLHQNNIAHRDIKADNFLYENKDADAELKMIDFGLSNRYQNSKGKQVKMETCVGTAYYVAPEVLKGGYGPECDAWSVGILMYMLLSGQFPFDGHSELAVFKSIIHDNIQLASGKWSNISAQAKDLVNQLLDKDKNRRIKVEQALQHPWFSSRFTDQEEITIDPSILQSLQSYKASTKFKKEAMAVCVNYLDLNDLKELRETFFALDVTNSGTLTAQELTDALSSSGLSLAREQIAEIISNTDYLGNGEINYSEFIAATLQTKIEVSEENLWQLFEHFDIDKTGFISEDNLLEVMSQAGKTLTPQQVKAMIKEVDLHKDGKVHFDEFKAMLGFENA